MNGSTRNMNQADNLPDWNAALKSAAAGFTTHRGLGSLVDGGGRSQHHLFAAARSLPEVFGAEPYDNAKPSREPLFVSIAEIEIDCQ